MRRGKEKWMERKETGVKRTERWAGCRLLATEHPTPVEGRQLQLLQEEGEDFAKFVSCLSTVVLRRMSTQLLDDETSKQLSTLLGIIVSCLMRRGE